MRNIKVLLLNYLLVLISGCSFFPSSHERNNNSPNNEEQNKIEVKLLSPQARLKKLSFHLRGVSPSLEEYDQLENNLSSKEQMESFFKNKTTVYLQTPEHLGRMIERLDELFGVELIDMTENIYNNIPEKLTDDHFNLNSMDLLFRKVIKNNLSWDALYTNKEYEIVYPAFASFNRPSDLGFFNAVKPSLPPSSDGIIRRGDDSYSGSDIVRGLLRAQFDPKDERIAGAFTTSRFLSRYNTTLLNKNRKRAAALFRILLCDDMKPTIAADEDVSDLLIKSFPKSNSDRNPIFSDNIRHGTVQSCMVCHQKLDPMGETFRTAGNVLSPEYSEGALFYPAEGGRTVNIPARGVGHLTEAVIEQPEYVQCQVRHFWNWFVGKDKALTSEQLFTLTQEFERLQRKPNDFISYLLQTKQFQEDESNSFSHAANFSQVQPLFSRCTNCHNGVINRAAIPSFTKMPFGGTLENHKKWIDKIAHSLDLAGNGSARNMPPVEAGWKLSIIDRDNIRNWINQGAPDENGLRSVDGFSIPNVDEKPDVEKKSAGFGHYGLRYIAANDMQRLWRQKFPLTVKSPLFSSINCTLDRKAFGYFNPSTIEPFYPGPSITYVKTLSKCILEFSKAEFEIIKNDKLKYDNFLGQKALAMLINTPYEDLRTHAHAFAWTKIPSEIRSEIANHLVQSFVGKNVALREKEIVQQALNATEGIAQDTATEAMQRILLTAILQDEFLTY